MAVSRKNYYAGWPEADLLVLRRQLQEQLQESMVSINSGETSVGIKQNSNPGVLLDRVEYALYLINSTTYPYTPRITQTVLTFSQSGTHGY